MNIATLDAIVDNSHFVKDEFTPGNLTAKEQLKDCLPIERSQFQEAAKDIKTDFRKGYDDRFPRVDMSFVENAVKQMNGELVPAFAIYNTNSPDNEYVKSYALTNSSRYKNQSDVNKKMVPHNPLQIKLMNHFYRNWNNNQDGIGFCVFGVLFQIPNFLWFTNSVGLHLTALGFSLGGTFLFLYGLGIYNWEPGQNITRTFTHKFSGVIPNDIRNLVKSERQNFDKILLVEEAFSWKIDDKIVEVPKNYDPLIVGCKDGVHYLLAKFDVTPLENLIATEFSA